PHQNFLLLGRRTLNQSPKKKSLTPQSKSLLKTMSEDGKGRGLIDDQQSQFHYGTFQGVANYNPPAPQPLPHPVVGFPQPVPPPGFTVDSRYNHQRHNHYGYQTVEGYAIVEGRPVSEPSLPCCGIGMGWVLYVYNWILSWWHSLVYWNFYSTLCTSGLQRKTWICCMHSSFATRRDCCYAWGNKGYSRVVRLRSATKLNAWRYLYAKEQLIANILLLGLRGCSTLYLCNYYVYVVVAFFLTCLQNAYLLSRLPNI
ncbi:hypothetical protein F2P56_006996, partial [Juglans regia]